MRWVAAEVVEARVARLVDFGSLRDEGLQDVGVDFVWRDAHLVHGLGKVLGPVSAGHGRREVGGVHALGGSFEVAKHVGDHFAVEVLLPLSGEPADDVGAEVFFAQHFPDGFALAGGSGDRDHLAGDGVDLSEAWDLVVVGHLARGNGGPEHGRELGLEGGEIAVNAAIHEGADAIHAAFFEEGVDDFPVC